MRRLFLSSVFATSLLSGIADAQTSPIRTPLPPDTYITVGNLDWAWAAPVSSLNAPIDAGDAIYFWRLYPPEFHEGWRYATAEEMANRPPASAFLLNPELGPAGGVRNATAYWTSNLWRGYSVSDRPVDFADAEAGLVRSRPVPAADSYNSRFETWYVRDVATSGQPIQSPEHARADFNNDGLLDIVWHHPETGYLTIYSMGEYRIRTVAVTSDSIATDANLEMVGTGDFNGDGKPDVVWRNRLYGFVGVWLLDGLDTVGVVSFSTPRVDDIAWKIVAVGDLTGDGQADILWRHDTGPLALWEMDGTTVISGEALVGDPGMAGNPDWRVASIADMNGDGQNDVLWRHSGGLVGVWLMWGTGVFGVQLVEVPTEFDAAWQIVATLDADRDGHQDIVWRRLYDGVSGDFERFAGALAISFMDGLTRNTVLRTNLNFLYHPPWPVGVAPIEVGYPDTGSPVSYSAGWTIIGPR